MAPGGGPLRPTRIACRAGRGTSLQRGNLHGSELAGRQCCLGGRRIRLSDATVHNTDPNAAKALFLLAQSLLVVIAIPIALQYVALGLLILRTRVLPTLMGWFAFLGAAIALLSWWPASTQCSTPSALRHLSSAPCYGRSWPGWFSWCAVLRWLRVPHGRQGRPDQWRHRRNRRGHGDRPRHPWRPGRHRSRSTSPEVLEELLPDYTEASPHRQHAYLDRCSRKGDEITLWDLEVEALNQIRSHGTRFVIPRASTVVLYGSKTSWRSWPRPGPPSSGPSCSNGRSRWSPPNERI